MKYITLYENYNPSIVSEIRNCFLPVTDFSDIVIKMPKDSKHLDKWGRGQRPKVNPNYYNIRISFNNTDDDVTTRKITTDGVEHDSFHYRKIKNSTELHEEIMEAIEKCINYIGLELDRIDFRWVAIGEFDERLGHIPQGILTKIFRGQPHHKHDNIDKFDSFYEERCELVRFIELSFNIQ